MEYLGHSQTPSELHIFMECCHMSLDKYLKHLLNNNERVKVHQLHYISREIARGLQYLHELEKPIIHRDLKSKNVMKFFRIFITSF